MGSAEGYAGQVYINDSGKIDLINNNSGYYQPNVDELVNQAKLLRDAGLTSKDFDVVDVTQ